MGSLLGQDDMSLPLPVFPLGALKLEKGDFAIKGQNLQGKESDLTRCVATI